MLIGSAAAIHHFKDYPRSPKDLDFISSIKIPDTDSKYCSSYEAVLKKYPHVNVAPPEILYTLKVSHSFWSQIHWDKTMFDIRFFQSKGIKLDEELFPILYKDCEERYGKKKVYLDKLNDDFFKDGVKRKYVHDSIHAAVAFYDKPLYEKIKKDSSKALTSFDLFNALSLEDKRKLVFEEAYVTAIERFLIPNNFEGISAYSAYMKSLKLLITSMTRGFFPKFIVENYIDFSKNDGYDYIEKFKLNQDKLQLL